MREERRGDRAAIRRVNDAAFGQADESRLIDRIRSGAEPCISLVAVRGEEVVGHILFAPVCLEPSRPGLRIAGLGPMSVCPEHQRKGIGGMLVEAGLAECRRAGYSAVVVVGHQEYYPRFGFTRASSFGLKCAYSVPDEAFMALAIRDGALDGCAGRVKYLPPFDSV